MLSFLDIVRLQNLIIKHNAEVTRVLQDNSHLYSTDEIEVLIHEIHKLVGIYSKLQDMKGDDVLE